MSSTTSAVFLKKKLDPAAAADAAGDGLDFSFLGSAFESSVLVAFLAAANMEGFASLFAGVSFFTAAGESSFFLDSGLESFFPSEPALFAAGESFFRSLVALTVAGESFFISTAVFTGDFRAGDFVVVEDCEVPTSSILTSASSSLLSAIRLKRFRGTLVSALSSWSVGGGKRL